MQIFINMNENQINRITAKLLNEAPKAPKALTYAEKIAKQIYDSKGVIWDNEASAIGAIRKIKTLAQYKDVLKALQKLTGGRGIGQYLKSFTKLNQRLEIVNHLKSFIPENQWGWTIEYIVPYSDFKYVNSKTYPGSIPKNAGQSNAATALIAYYSKKGLWKKGGPNIDKETWKDYHHEILFTAEIVTSLIPLIGPVIAGGIALADAKIYWDEGDKYTAGFYAMLTAIPYIGPIIKKIPGAKQLTNKLAIQFAKKLTLMKNGAKPTLTALEQTLLPQISKFRNLISSETSKYYTKKLAAKKVGKALGKQAINYTAARTAWNWVYKNAGFQQAEIASLIKPSLKQLASKSKKLKVAAENKINIKNIVREELQLAREQFTKQGGSGAPAEQPDLQSPTPSKKNTGEYTLDDSLMNLLSNLNGQGIAALGILVAIGGFGVYKGYRVLKFKMNLFRNSTGKTSLFKDPVGFIKSWKSGKLEQELMNTKAVRRLSKEDQKRLLQFYRNPKAITFTVAASIDDMIAQFANGKITAEELKSVLPAESLSQYQGIIDSIERSRGGGPTYVGPKTSAYGTNWHDPETLRNL